MDASQTNFSEQIIKCEYNMTMELQHDNESGKSLRQVKKIAKKSIVTSLDEFAQNSTLHGLRYIADRTLNLVEKLFWTVVVIASVVMCAFLIRNVWIKWQTSPIIITMNEKLIPVTSVLYPSVTICPQIKIKKNMYNFKTQSYYFKNIFWKSGINDTLKKRLSKVSDINLVCDEDLSKSAAVVFPMQNYVNVTNILEVALDFEDIFKKCEWVTNDIPCEILFQKVLTREGICFTMNALDANEIVRQDNVKNLLFLSDINYRKNLSVVYPIYGSANDAKAEFSVTLRESVNYKNEECKISKGFRVYIQEPGDMPHTSLHSYHVKTNEIVSFALKFESVTATEDLRSYPIQTRQCYFSDEPYLNFFLTYTQSNCRIECLTNFTKQLCGCVAFFMPTGNTSAICSPFYMYCVDIAHVILYGLIRPVQIEEFKKIYSGVFGDSVNMSLMQRGREFADSCKCFPTCNSVTYDTDVIKMEYDFKIYFDYICKHITKCEKYVTQSKFSKIELMFKRPNFAGMVRSSMFGTTDFIAQCGGLLGLFLGFSFLTVIEIIYYITLRFGCVMRRNIVGPVASHSSRSQEEPGPIPTVACIS